MLGRRYGIDAGRSSDLGGSLDLDLLVADGPARYVVRVYRPWVTAGRLGDIQLVRRALDRGGVPCAALVPARDGRPWVRVGGRLVEVERFVDHHAKMDCWSRLHRGLPLLGRIHSLLRPIQLSAEGRSPRFANYLDPAQVRSSTAQATARIRAWRPTPAEGRLVDAYDRGLDHTLTTAERAAVPWAMAGQPLWAIGGWLAWLDDQRAARNLAAVMSAEVERGLGVVHEIDSWQQAFV